MSYKYLFCLILFPLSLSSHQDIPNQTAKTGNFANAITPATVFGFGQNILSRNQFSIYLNASQQKYKNENFVAAFPFFLYGITDSLSLYVSVPTIPKFKLDDTTARGIGNIVTQLEYAFIQAQDAHAQAQATIVANVGFPNTALTNATRSIKDAFNAFGSYDRYNYFVGGTASYLSTDVYFYTSEGYVFNTASCQTITTTAADMLTTCSTEKIRTGDVFYYQFGIGHNLGNPWGATLLGNIELNGALTKKDTSKGVSLDNTGSNIILLGPTLTLTTDHMLLQAGIQLPVFQKVNGIQNMQRYQTLFAFSYTF